MDIEREDRKRRTILLISRLTGLLVSCGIFITLILYYFMQVDYTMMTLIVIILSAVDFTLNASIRKMRDTTALWERVNALFSVIFFLAGIGLLVYGLITGMLILF